MNIETECDGESTKISTCTADVRVTVCIYEDSVSTPKILKVSMQHLDLIQGTFYEKVFAAHNLDLYTNALSCHDTRDEHSKEIKRAMMMVLDAVYRIYFSHEVFQRVTHIRR